MRKPLRLKEECYNCYNLFGAPFYPKCFARKDCSRDSSNGKCDSYKPIVKEALEQLRKENK